MRIDILPAVIEDAEKIRDVMSEAFYSDYIKYGYCPAYNQSIEHVEKNILSSFSFKIMVAGEIVGYARVIDEGEGCYWLCCLCIIPKVQNLGLGKKAITFIEEQFPLAVKWGLDTPADNIRNIRFYEQCGFKVIKEYVDKNIRLAVFEKKVSELEY